MLAVVKTPHIDIRMKGDIPSPVINILKFEFGKMLKIKNDSKNDDWTYPEKMQWFNKTKREMTPGLYAKTYREIRGWSQKELGIKLGGFTRQRVSEIETSKRGISKETAKKLAALFDVPVDKFI